MPPPALPVVVPVSPNIPNEMPNPPVAIVPDPPPPPAVPQVKTIQVGRNLPSGDVRIEITFDSIEQKNNRMRWNFTFLNNTGRDLSWCFGFGDRPAVYSYVVDQNNNVSISLAEKSPRVSVPDAAKVTYWIEFQKPKAKLKAIDLTGRWNGTLSVQGELALRTVDVAIIQNGNNFTGSSTVTQGNFFKTTEFTGVINDGVFEFRETKFLENPRNKFSALIKGELRIATTGATMTLSGPWQTIIASDNRGQIELTKK